MKTTVNGVYHSQHYQKYWKKPANDGEHGIQFIAQEAYLVNLIPTHIFLILHVPFFSNKTGIPMTIE